MRLLAPTLLELFGRLVRSVIALKFAFGAADKVLVCLRFTTKGSMSHHSADQCRRTILSTVRNKRRASDVKRSEAPAGAEALQHEGLGLVSSLH